MTYQPIASNEVPPSEYTTVNPPDASYQNPGYPPQYYQTQPQVEYIHEEFQTSNQQNSIPYSHQNIESYQNASPIQKPKQSRAAKTIVLPNEPATVYCPKCDCIVTTRIEKTISGLQNILAFLFFMICFVFSFLWFTCPCLKHKIHVCTRCREVIGKVGEVVATE